MKSIFLSALFAGMMVFATDCSGPQKPDPKVEACKSACVKKMDLCVKKAARNEAKKAACEAVGDKCTRDCIQKR